MFGPGGQNRAQPSRPRGFRTDVPPPPSFVIPPSYEGDITTQSLWRSQKHTFLSNTQSFHSIHQALSSQLILGHVCCALSWVGVLWLPLVREMDICRHNRDDIPAFLCSQTSRLSTCCNALCLTLFTPGVIGEGCLRTLFQYPGPRTPSIPLCQRGTPGSCWN